MEATKDNKKQPECASFEHDVKLEQVYFDQKIKGLKNWELRKNDRDYKEGDMISFHEVLQGVKTKRRIRFAKIQSIFHGGEYGLEKGYVIFQHTKGYFSCY